MRDPLRTYLLGFQIDVCRHPLCDQKPEVLRPQRQWVMMCKGRSHRSDESVTMAFKQHALTCWMATFAASVYKTTCRLFRMIILLT